jgi:ATP-dependent RNA helicase DbpA
VNPTLQNLSFAALPLAPAQLNNLADLGYREMTAIQAAALPLALAGSDLIGQAKTGSGKTAAFAIPLLAKLNPRNFGTQALVLCPTRELASQVAEEIRRLARYQQNIKVVTLCGGQAIGPQIGSLEHGAHVVVGTPGRIGDHLRKQTLSLDQVATLVLDEADRMLEMGFQADIEQIVGQTPSARQTLLFSATFPDNIQSLSDRFLRQAQRVSVEAEHSQAHIRQHFFLCRDGERVNALLRLLRHYQAPAAVVFCNTRQGVAEVCAQLEAAGIHAGALHGEMEQRDRDQVLIQFRQQSCPILVATDVAARGIDIDDITHVINYQIPDDEQAYVHRIGRTGRAGKTGIAVTLVDWDELPRWTMIDKALDLSCPDPAETYSSSPHLYEELGIPTDAAGSVGTPEKSPAKREPRAPREGTAEKPRTRDRSRRRTRGGNAAARHADGAATATAADGAGEAATAETAPAAGSDHSGRRRRRRRPGKPAAEASSNAG